MKTYVYCEYYKADNPKHCSIYNKRPSVCASFPRDPDDLEHVKEQCSLKFIDSDGRIIDCWMNPKVKLTRVK
jgi:Fe-S-cluster containining protein